MKNTVRIVLFLLSIGFAKANVSLPDLFGNGMVLQREKPIAFFGNAAPNEKVTVTLGSDSKSANAGADGKWKLFLDPKPAGGPFNVTVSGNNTLTFSNVMIGEVWFVSGQSNAAVPLSYGAGPGEKSYLDPTMPDNVKQDNYPNVRYHMVNGSWLNCAYDASEWDVKQYASQLGYFLSRELHKRLNVTVGFITRAQVATCIEWFLDPVSVAQFNQFDGSGEFFNSNIAPVVGYTIRGAVWSQGECNAGTNNAEYGARLRAMITNWRTLWNDDFYFYIVQLGGVASQWDPLQTINEPVMDGGWVNVRQHQLDAMSIPKTGTFTTWDLSDGDIHPRNKKEIAIRMSDAAMRMIHNNATYPEGLGPVYYKKTISGNKLILEFLHANGLKFSNNDTQLKNMAIGDGTKWRFANGTIVNNKLELSHPDIANPTEAKFMWSSNPLPGNLVNSDGIGALSFNTNSLFIPWEVGTSITVSSVAITPNLASLDVGQTQQLNAQISPANAVTGLSWTSSDPTVAIVNASGMVTALKQGTATITVTTSVSNKTSLASITVNPVSTSSNLALNHYYSSSTEEANNLGKNAVDGNKATRWAAADGNVPQSIIVDLGANYRLKQSKINWETSTWIYKYKIEGSLDGINWQKKLLTDKQNNTEAAAETQDILATDPVRFVRLSVTGFGNGGFWVSLNEWELYGDLAILTTSDMQDQNFELSISPNPFFQTVNITLPQANNTIEIYHITGELISKTTTTSITYTFGEELKSGMYLAKVNGKSFRIVKK